MRKAWLLAVALCTVLLLLRSEHFVLPSFAGTAPSAVVSSKAALDPAAFKEGDLIFQPSALSSQSLAIKLATGSQYSHCGIVFFKSGRPYVFEAVRTVSWTPLESWIKRGVNGHYVLMRLKNRDTSLSPQTLDAMRRIAAGFAGKSYDLLFQWTDEKIYCSELVWKIYERGAGIVLAPLRKIRDYDLNHEEVQKKVKERFGMDIPWDETVIAPFDIMESGILEVVGGN